MLVNSMGQNTKPNRIDPYIPSVELTNFLWLKYELVQFPQNFNYSEKGCQVATAVGSCLDTTFGSSGKKIVSLSKSRED